MDSGWVQSVPKEAWASADVYAEWLQRGSWTLNEAALLLMGLRPTRELLNWKDAPVVEAQRLVDFLKSHAGTDALVPIDPRDHASSQRFSVRQLLDLAVIYETVLPLPMPEVLRQAWSNMQPSSNRQARQSYAREQTYRTAIAILAAYYDECRPKRTASKKRRVMGHTVATLIADHIALLMPEKRNMQPPLSVDRMGRLISEALKMGDNLPDKPVNYKGKK